MKQTLFFIAIVLILVGLMFFVITLPERIAQSQASLNNKTEQSQMDYANKLLSKGLNESATEVFEDYLANTSINSQEKARLLYKLGSIYMDLHKYEKALKAFYKAEMIEPNSGFAQEMNQEIIEALENLGMSSQARYELESRTSLGKHEETKEKIIARIGTKAITDTEIDRALKGLPQWMKKSFDDPQKRQEFINNYIAQEVLYIKAKRLGLDTKEETRETFEQLKKQIVVNELLNKEVEQKLDKITPEDIKMYYDANKENLSVIPAQLKVKYLSFENEAQKDEIVKKLQDPETKLDEVWISQGESNINGIGEAKDIISGLFLKNKGQFSDPLKINNKFYIFAIVDKKERQEKSFDDVKSQAEYEYKMKKQQEISQSLLKKALEEQEVEIYSEAKEQTVPVNK